MTILAQRRRNVLWMVLFLALAVLLSAPRWRPQIRRSGHFKPKGERRAVAAAAFPLLDGGQWSLADHRGKVVLINYWATWCEPCREELPGLSRIARESAAKGLAVVGVSLDAGPGAPAAVRVFAARYRLPYPIAVLPAPDPGVVTVPTTLLIDRQGHLAKTYAGVVAEADLVQDVAALLAEP